MNKEGFPVGREVFAGIGTHILQDGRKIIVNKIMYNEGVIAGKTARHEIAHVLPAVYVGSGLEWVTIRPSKDYLGAMMPKGGEFNSVVAAGSSAMGHEGAESDKAKVGYYGHDLHSSESAARQVIMEHDEEREELEKELEVKQDLNEHDVWSVIDRTRNPKAQITEYDKNGREIRSMVQAVRKVDGMVSYFIEENLKDRLN